MAFARPSHLVATNGTSSIQILEQERGEARVLRLRVQLTRLHLKLTRFRLLDELARRQQSYGRETMYIRLFVICEVSLTGSVPGVEKTYGT